LFKAVAKRLAQLMPIAGFKNAEHLLLLKAEFTDG
jgi:hypothetical protein